MSGRTSAPVAVSGVLQSAPGGLQGQQLHRFRAAERRRRDAVAQRVEGDAGQEAAPLGGGRLAMVDGRVPALGRDLAHRVHSGDHIRPEGGQVGRLREHARHADHGDVERSGRDRLPYLVRRGRLRRPQGEMLGGSRGHRLVQCRDGRGRRAQHGHLAGHEHSLGELAPLVDRREAAVGGSVDALAGDAQPADVEPLQLLPDPPVRHALGAQPGLLVAVTGGERAR